MTSADFRPTRRDNNSVILLKDDGTDSDISYRPEANGIYYVYYKGNKVYYKDRHLFASNNKHAPLDDTGHVIFEKEKYIPVAYYNCAPLRNLTKGDNDRAVEESIRTGRDAPYNPNRCDLLRPIYTYNGRYFEVIKVDGHEINGHAEQLTPEYINEYKHFLVLGDISRDLNSGGEFKPLVEHDPLNPYHNGKYRNGGKIIRNKKSRKFKKSKKLMRRRGVRSYRNTRRNHSRL